MLYSYINNSKVYTYVFMHVSKRACSEVNMYVRMCDRSRRTKEYWHAHKFTFIHKHMISNRYMERGTRAHKTKHKKRQIDGYTHVVYACKMVLDHITGRVTYTYMTSLKQVDVEETDRQIYTCSICISIYQSIYLHTYEGTCTWLVLTLSLISLSAPWPTRYSTISLYPPAAAFIIAVHPFWLQ